ncbi:MAG: hypothetical protein HY078_15210 [Elusimicrobia bacterium]|nr:hypothetical protein [Elusimicrobiota bacterium]
MVRALAAALAALAVAVSADAAAPAPGFTIGIFGVDGFDALQFLKEGGFNAATPTADAPALTEAASRFGIRLAAGPADPARPPADKRSETMEDALLVGTYPVPKAPLESAGNRVAGAVGASAGKPVWAVVQAFDWSQSAVRDSEKPREGRFPDIAEMRFLSYDAILNGASGVWFFAYSFGGATLPQAAERWFAVTSVSRELSEMVPILRDGAPAKPPFPIAPGGISARAWTYRGRDYVIAANRQNKAVKMPLEILDSRWRPLFEVRRYPKELLTKDGDGWLMPPYRVMVFERRALPW